MLLQMLQQQQRQQQGFPDAQPGGFPGQLGRAGTAQSLGLQQPFAPVGQAPRPNMPPFSVGGGGADSLLSACRLPI